MIALSSQRGGKRLVRTHQSGVIPDRANPLTNLAGKTSGGSDVLVEWQELTTLTDQLELLHAGHPAALADLANLRGVALDTVIQQLGLRFSD